ncbi:MAG: putative metal-dependent hydrolase [Solimicrobium sp.]|jgi:predicted metal-dependent hydrolase|nr:putative metal-dependent hydrolase [Solimicrobium sp.]
MKFSPLSVLEKFFQYDLFDAPSPSTIDVVPEVRLPKILAEHKHSVQLGPQCVPYELRRSKRRSVGFLITGEGLRVTAPARLNLADINSAIISKQRWILSKLNEQQCRVKEPIATPTIWITGAQLPFLGQPATLRVQYGEASYFDSTTNLITLNLPSDALPAQCQKHLHAWLMNQARRQFSERLPHFAGQLKVQYHSLALTNARTLWGTCNIRGQIRLNWRLIHLAPHLIDYVVVHELAHLHEMNHSPRFWARVESVCPDYAAARKELKRLDMRTLPQFDNSRFLC